MSKGRKLPKAEELLKKEMSQKNFILARLEGDLPFNFIAISSDSIVLIQLLDSAPLPDHISRLRAFECPREISKQICYRGRRKLIWVTVP